ncbi:hypothetical protein FVE85_4876 [Porphyridium purpureum]|uniref:DUF3253 domain-containing protein n=1 Tax=Porphyridium purpureum TaxID=35688 RepID=A0A5J4YQK4_PORPP|nr:hypothetical protein FVE85_4876 [Porphyridium purpureum]|eukprot:POR6412..scf236_6
MSCVSDEQVRACILVMCAERGTEKSVCPSECARRLAEGHHDAWRGLMAVVREQGAQLAHDGRIHVLQKNQRVDPRTARGPIRYRIARAEQQQQQQQHQHQQQQ